MIDDILYYLMIFIFVTINNSILNNVVTTEINKKKGFKNIVSIIFYSFFIPFFLTVLVLAFIETGDEDRIKLLPILIAAGISNCLFIIFSNKKSNQNTILK
jgi:glucan phosphoethanolaminetransferase (alkaline phosphatase superfamily)